MSDEIVSIGVEVTGSDEAAANADKVKQAVGEIGQGGQQAASGMSAFAQAAIDSLGEAEKIEIAVDGIKTALDLMVANTAPEKLASELQLLRNEFVQDAAEMRASGEVAAGGLRAMELGIEEIDRRLAALAAPAKTAFDEVADAATGSAKQVATSWKEFVTNNMSSYMKELGSHGAAMKQLGEDWREWGKAAAEAAKSGQTALTGVNAAAAQSATQLTGIAAAVKAGETAVESFNTKYLAGSPRITTEVGKIVAAHENLRREIIATYGSIEAAAPADVAALKNLEGELETATIKTQQLRNAIGDNAVRFKEAGTQMDMLGGSIQALTAGMGGAAGEFGRLAGQAGNIAGAFERLKDSAGATGINTLALSNGYATLAGQLAAVAVVAGTAYESTIALQRAAEVDMRAYDDFTKSIPPFKEALHDALIEMGGVVNQATDLAASLINLAGDPTDPQRWRDLGVSLKGTAVEFDSGRLAAEGYAAALSAGVDAADRAKLTEQQLIILGNAHNLAVRGGAEGQRIWNDAVRQADGSASVLYQAILKLNPELQKYATQANIIADLEKKNDTATNGHTARIDALVGAIQKYLPEAEKHRADLFALSGQLEAAVKSTNGLTDARGRDLLQLAAQAKAEGDLAAKIKEENEAREKAAKDAKKHAEDEQKAADAQAKAVKTRTDAVDKELKALADLRFELDLNKKAREDAEAKVAERNSQLEYEQRTLAGITDALEIQRQKVADLAAQYGASDPMTVAAIDKQKQLETQYENSSKRVSDTKDEVDKYRDKVRDANTEIERLKDRIGEHVEKLGEQITKLTEAGTAHETYSGHVGTAVDKTKNLGDEGAKAGGKLASELAPKAEAAATGVIHIGQHADIAVTALGKVAGAFDDQALIAKLSKVDAAMENTTKKAHDLAAALDAASKAGDDGVDVTPPADDEELNLPFG